MKSLTLGFSYDKIYHRQQKGISMLILEGPDGAGKTTLAKEIVDRFDIPVSEKVVQSDTTHSIDLVDWVDNNLEEGLQWTLFDRHRLISEPIYGTIVRNRPSEPEFMDSQWLLTHMQRFYDIEPTIIYCLPPLETIKQNLEGDLDNTVVALFSERLYAAYATRAAIDYSLSPGNVIIWDYTTAGPTSHDELFEAVHRLKRDTHDFRS